jgi:hypothetical protein
MFGQFCLGDQQGGCFTGDSGSTTGKILGDESGFFLGDSLFGENRLPVRYFQLGTISCGFRFGDSLLKLRAKNFSVSDLSSAPDGADSMAARWS